MVVLPGNFSDEQGRSRAGLVGGFRKLGLIGWKAWRCLLDWEAIGGEVNGCCEWICVSLDLVNLVYFNVAIVSRFVVNVSVVLGRTLLALETSIMEQALPPL